MINICPRCEKYSTEKIIDKTNMVAICPYCGYRTPFIQLPMFIITGASGTGKSTIFPKLLAQIPDCVFLESDCLIGSFSELVPKCVWGFLTWLSHLALPLKKKEINIKSESSTTKRASQSNQRKSSLVHAYRNIWLRIIKNIHQSGRPVVLSVRATPEHFEDCPERKYIGNIHYLALVCSTDELEKRIKNRYPKIVKKMLVLNEWYKANANTTDPKMTVLDTTRKSPEETVAETIKWIRETLKKENL